MFALRRKNVYFFTEVVSEQQYSKLLKEQLARFERLGFKVNDKEKSIHESESVRFSQEVLKAGSWQTNVLKNGLSLDFVSRPGMYRENNCNQNNWNLNWNNWNWNWINWNENDCNWN